MAQETDRKEFALVLDTANEYVAVGLAHLEPGKRTATLIQDACIPAHRASNTQLLPNIDKLMSTSGISRSQIACVVVGRGPGSFTGVRIAMATAKGIASALQVGLIGVSSLDAIAWHAWQKGARGQLIVVADAMRKEVYPARYVLRKDGIERLDADHVVKATLAAERIANEQQAGSTASPDTLIITGDALVKYAELFAPYGLFADERSWMVKADGLTACLQSSWRNDEADPFDAARHNPAFALPVYTRLSDAEENERARLALTDPKDLETGVQAHHPSNQGTRSTMHKSAALIQHPSGDGFTYASLDAAHVPQLCSLEREIMEDGAWTQTMIADELGRKDRSWWAAYDSNNDLVAYAGCMVVDGDMQILRVGVHPRCRRCGLATRLLDYAAHDARDLGATSASLEVRASNAGAQALYRHLGFDDLGTRPRYYADGENALIMQGKLPLAETPDDNNEGAKAHATAGMPLMDQTPAAEQIEPVRPLILAIESSCDETAAAIVTGEGTLIADIVASQVDFHARFGGVVPEIASRKHIEAICGVCDECLDVAAQNLGRAQLSWHDLDGIAVTYAPGLLGALVVGVAFAKGAAWASELPFIGVNHLEGHLYANKIGAPDIQVPLVASLVSGGNTLLVHVRDWGDYETLGQTIDDAVGEAFDKVAKALGLGYPGGPVISRFAAQGNPNAIPFPRAMLHSGDLRFSLSGLKTAVVNYIDEQRRAGAELNIPDIAASFQQAVIDVQIAKAKTALEQTGAKTFCLGGGVAANPALRSAYEDLCNDRGIRLIMPPLKSCGDNAGMIALVALDRFRQGRFFDLDADASARGDLDVPY